MAEETEKKNIVDWMHDHPKTVFTIRFVFWAIFSAGLPFAFIAWRYGIFKAASKMQLSGWGMIGILLLAVFIITLIKYAYKGLKPGFLKQCLTGLVSVILPLVVLYALISSIESDIALFKQALGCVILCEMIGIPLNPLPGWLEKRRIEQKKTDAESVSDILWDGFFKRKKDSDK